MVQASSLPGFLGDPERNLVMGTDRRKVKVCFIGGGSVTWTPNIIRDIIFKKGMEQVQLDIHLLDIDLEAAEKIRNLFDERLAAWKLNRVSVTATDNKESAISAADFIIIAISTGRLKTMANDLAIPEKYGIYHTVGDTAGPGGWSRALRNIPVFKEYGEIIKRLAPHAFVLNYTNPMGVLTKVLSDIIQNNRVVGLCHGYFECLDILKDVFGLESEKELDARFGGLNHFFWILDFKVNGKDGYPMLKEKIGDGGFGDLIQKTHTDAMGWSSDKWFAGELYANFGYLPYVGDRHTCEFFNYSMTNPELMERFKLKRTFIADRQAHYDSAGKTIDAWINGKKGIAKLGKIPSRETAADIIHAALFSTGFSDVTNLVNTGQISNLPLGAVVETMGYVDSGGFSALNLGTLPENIISVVLPHVRTQMMTTEAGLTGDLELAMQSLIADPICQHIPPTDIRKLGLELLQSNKDYLPQFSL